MYRVENVESVPPGEHVPTADQRIVMGGVSWGVFEAILAARGDSAAPRVAYLEGTLELMSPSSDHEIIKKYVAEVIQAYLDHLGVTYEGVGSWLLENADEDAGLEPDECYILHELDKPRPDLAVEVVWTSGGMEKLEIYRRLGVGEVWIWKRNRITVHVLTTKGYEERSTSVCLPDFDFALAAEIILLPSLSAVRKALRQRLPPC